MKANGKISRIALVIALLAITAFACSKCVAEVFNALDQSEPETTKYYYGEITVTGKVQPNDYGMSLLQSNLDFVESIWSDRTISFEMYDINSGATVSYHTDKTFYAKSTIKAPYLVSLAEKDKSIFYAHEEDYKIILGRSDNERYDDMRKEYGSDALLDWCKQDNISESVGNSLYPTDATVDDFVKFWKRIYRYIAQPENADVKAYMIGSNHSPISEALGNKYLVCSKAGWTAEDESDTENGESITNDAGVVLAPGNPYIIAIFSTIPAEQRWLTPIVSCLDEIHTSIIEVQDS